MRNRVFFPQAALDDWAAIDRVDLTAEELVLRDEGRRYRIVEAVRITREVTDTPDPNEIVGKVKSRAFLNELGAEILENSMIIGDNAYDIVPGFAGAPLPVTGENEGATETDEAVLSAFLARST